MDKEKIMLHAGLNVEKNGRGRNRKGYDGG